MAPFFSIVIPAYNRADRLKDALESVFDQSFPDFEVIVVDDGSTDHTREVIAGIQDQRLRYFRKENEERSIARNFGIQQARGKYVNFLDSDDKFYAHHLETAHRMLLDHHFPEVGHLGYEMVDMQGNVLLQRNRLDDQVAKKLLHENILHGNAIFVRYDIISQYNFIPSPDAFISEDWYLWIRLAARYRICYDNTISSALIEHEERSLKSVNPDKLIRNTRLIVEYLEKDQAFVSKYHGYTGYFFANQYTFLTLVLALTKKRRWETILYLIRAIQYDWTVIGRKRFLASVKHWF